MIKTRKELINAYLEFFESKKHAIIPNASLIPEHDPTVLFTTAGMHPLVPFILGQEHPQGKRLCNVQKCIRTQDIDSVGNEMHLTFFEMLGNWSLGDYWKKEAISWSIEFLKLLGFEKEKICVTVFAGDEDVERDEESAKIWLSLGIPKERIFFLPKEENFWGPAGMTGPCGPCTEMFIDNDKAKCSEACRPGCACGKYFEVWNDVFMEYNFMGKKYEKLKQKNVDTGMGVERTIAMLQGKSSVYETEVFLPIIKEIERLSGKKYGKDLGETRAMRIIVDHLKAATFILAEQIAPSNLDRGYVLRRLIRRAIRYGKELGIEKNFCSEIANVVIKIYKDDYKELERNKKFIFSEIEKEEERFISIIGKGLRKFEIIAKGKKKISGKDAFFLYQSFGFPVEMTKELALEKKLAVDEEAFRKEFEKHQELSRKSMEKRFKSGLADITEETTRLHTATHLLHQALRDVLGKHVMQKGSNITAERLRFDFSHDKKMSEEEIKNVESIVNEKIQASLTVTRREMKIEEAEKIAIALFKPHYGEKVSVYSIGNYSKEVCAGPHVNNTKELGHFRITKEEAVAAGVRRIKAVLE